MEPQMNADERRLNEITEQIIQSAFRVSNTLGCGFLEKVYENALAWELIKLGYLVEQQEPVKVYYDDIVVGSYKADILVNKAVIIEVKTVKGFDDVHTAQALNYLKATRIKVCLLLNFENPKVGIKRVVLNL